MMPGRQTALPTIAITGWFSQPRRERVTTVPSTAARTSPTAPAMRRWPSGSFFPHSQHPPSHFPVVTRVLTDSIQGQVFMGLEAR